MLALPSHHLSLGASVDQDDILRPRTAGPNDCSSREETVHLLASQNPPRPVHTTMFRAHQPRANSVQRMAPSRSRTVRPLTSPKLNRRVQTSIVNHK